MRMVPFTYPIERRTREWKFSEVRIMLVEGTFLLIIDRFKNAIYYYNRSPLQFETLIGEYF